MILIVIEVLEVVGSEVMTEVMTALVTEVVTQNW